jgi:hypothetical protein
MRCTTFFIGCLVLLFSHGIAINPSSQVIRARPTIVRARSDLKDESNTNVVVLDLNDVVAGVGRMPMSVITGAKAACKGFFSTFCLIVPVGLIWHITKVRTPKVWWNTAYSMGRDWGRTSAFFIGGDAFAETLRGKKDKFNSYIGSGLGSMVMRMDEGPWGMAQGFVVGFCFLYAFDLLGARSGAINTTEGLTTPMRGNA